MEVLVRRSRVRHLSRSKATPMSNLARDTSYRCNGKGHISNVCLIRRVHVVLEGDGEELEGENDEYADVEFTEEESDERVNFLLQRVLLTSKDKGQRKNLFKTHFSI